MWCQLWENGGPRDAATHYPLLIDELAVVSSLIVLIWGFLLLLAFSDGNLALIAAFLEIFGGLIGLITSIAT